MPAAPSTASKKAAVRKAGGDYARKQVAEVFSKSHVEDFSEDFPKFSKNELNMGRVLGKGGFCTVNEIRGFKIGGIKQKKGKKSEEDCELVNGEMEGREFIAEHCIRNGGDARYAVKYLSKENIEDPAMFIQGIKDMAIETRFLSSIEHPNIVKMRAIATVDPFHEEYFIVMDRLYDTLEVRIKKWAKKDKGTKGLAGKLSDRRGKKADKLMEDRLVAAFDLAAALEYLHGRHIVYRDLKPENVGFDCRGDVKIFDFGLAKEVLPEMKEGDDTYKMTGDTGSLRYMAPEVALCKPYNYTVDTYSFCIMLWEMLALEKPFVAYTTKSFAERVHKGGKRPQVKEDWPVPIKLLLKRGWSEDTLQRHSMESVTKILKKELVSIRAGDETGLEHQRRRSTFVFRKNYSRRAE